MHNIISAATQYRRVIYGLAASAVAAYLLKRIWQGYSSGGALTGKKVDTAFFVGITGLPTHKGHVDIVEKAMRKVNCGKAKIWVSLGSQEYVAAKYGNYVEAGSNYDPTRIISEEDRTEMVKNAFRGLELELMVETPQTRYADNLQHARESTPATWRFFVVQGSDFARRGGVLGVGTITVGRAGEKPPKIGLTVSREENDPLSKASSSEVAKGHLQYLHPANVEIFLRAKATASGQHPDAAKRAEFIANCKNSGICPKGWYLKFVAAETLAATQAGRYGLCSGQQLLGASQRIAVEELNIPRNGGTEETVVEVRAADCLDVAEEMVRTDPKLGVLLLASWLEPGGGWHDTNMGQEEDLCRRSDLAGLMQHLTDEMFRDGAWFPLTKDIYRPMDKPGSTFLIHTPDVTVFRQSHEKDYSVMKETFKCGMVFGAGVVRGARYGEQNLQEYSEDQLRDATQGLIRAHLNCFAEMGYTSLVLGAFGCGAYKNPPKLVAECYAELLGEEFKGVFKRVVFAVKESLHSENVRAFQDALDKL